MPLHRRISGSAHRIDVAGYRVRRDLGMTDPRRSGLDADRERVVEPDRRAFAEHVDAQLQALVRAGQRRQGHSERVRQNLVAQAHGEQRAPRRQPRRHDLAHAAHPRAVVERVARSGAGDQQLCIGCLGIRHLGPVRDAHGQPEVAELVRQHRRESVLGVDYESRTPEERAGSVGVLRVQPERSQTGVA